MLNQEIKNKKIGNLVNFFKNKEDSFDKIKQAGFTLLELVVVMAMIGIVSASTLKLVRFSEVGRNLGLATAELKGAIRTTQTLALAPPVKLDDQDELIHLCGFVIQEKLGSNGSVLEIKYVYPSGASGIKVCRKLKSIDEICSGVTECEVHETKHFEGFKIKQANADTKVKIYFGAPYGKVIGAEGVTGNITITQDGESNYSKIIEVNDRGKINTKK